MISIKNILILLLLVFLAPFYFLLCVEVPPAIAILIFGVIYVLGRKCANN